MEIKSSYAKNQYAEIFKLLCFLIEPKKIVEFGILNGYSLKVFEENTKNCKITAIDLFDDFKFNAANEEKIREMFPNIEIIKENFYNMGTKFEDRSIDIMHIDIANDGDVYDYAINNYLRKVKGIMILEGGSEERDEVEWMQKFKKKKIKETIEKYQNNIKIFTLQKFPSLTIIDNR